VDKGQNEDGVRHLNGVIGFISLGALGMLMGKPEQSFSW